MSDLRPFSMREVLTDPELLGDVLAGESWRGWRTLLIAMMGEALDDEERAIFTKLTGREREPRVRVDEFWAIVGRKGGKSRAIAVLIVYVACFLDHSSVLVAGERGVILCMSKTARQAGVVFGYVAGILESSPVLSRLVTNKTSEVLTLSNGLEIEIRPASFRGIRGITAVMVV